MRLVEDQDLRYRIAINILVLGFSLFGISQKTNDYHQSTAFERFMIDTLAPIQRSVTSLQYELSSFFTHYLANVHAGEENEKLKNRVKQLEETIHQHTELGEENHRLKNLLQFSEKIESTKVIAEVVAWDSSSDFNTLRLNKGSSHGIKLQSPVITADGLVGYVYRLTAHFCDVLTILDPNNRVDAIVARTRSHGIVEGISGPQTIMKYIARTEPVVLDDLVITSGLGKIYPKGIRVGTISQIERESYGITQNIEVKPSVNFSKLEEVMILNSDTRWLANEEWNALDEVNDLEEKEKSEVKKPLTTRPIKNNPSETNKEKVTP